MLATISLTALTAPATAMIGLPEMLVVLAIVVVLFGATKLPQLGKGVGEAIGNFKKAQRDAMRSEREEIDATPKLEASAARPVDVELEDRKSRV